MFALNEKVVYPGHGVAKICRIIERNVSGTMVHFFELEFFNKKMTILVPVNSLVYAGIRKLSSLETIDNTFAMLSEPFIKPTHETIATNWNKRNKEYQCKIRTGSIKEICKIYKDLMHIAAIKELSFGEKLLLEQTEFLLVEEIAMVTLISEDALAKKLRLLVYNDDKITPIQSCKTTHNSVANI